MELVGLVLFGVALILIGIGLAIGLVACGLAAILLGLGVVSSSVAIGIFRRRATDGVRAFLLQCGILAGIPAGAVCAWLLQTLFANLGNQWVIPFYGACGGAIAGVVVALLIDGISRRMHAWAIVRVRTSSLGARRALP